MTTELLTAIRDGVLVMTLNRPAARNAMNRSLSHEVAAALDLLERRADLRAAILTGAGGHFCSGMDAPMRARQVGAAGTSAGSMRRIFPTRRSGWHFRRC